MESNSIINNVYFMLPNWKWLALFGSAFGFYVLQGLLQVGLGKIKKQKNIFKEHTFLSYFIKEKIELGLSWIIIAILAMVVIENLELPLNFEKYLIIFSKVILAFNAIRVVYLAAEAIGQLIEDMASKTDTQVDDQLAPLATKTMKVIVVIVGGLIILQNFGVNVTALLAGLGIGGVALAFAAQDTVANVFGTITILLDTPFKLGDRIKIMDVDGIVEEVGFRSTRIRTLYNSVISLPNSVVAKEKIDNLTLRNNMLRFRTVLTFTYNSTPEQIAKFCEHLIYSLKQDRFVDQERISVTLNEFADSSLNVLVNFHYLLEDLTQETNMTQNYLYQIYAVAQQQKLQFAFPTRTLILENKALS